LITTPAKPSQIRNNKSFERQPKSQQASLDATVQKPLMPFRRKREGGDVCAIYVHAGAGFHSYANEKHHLTACAEYDSPT
jgi:hypothetical protein